MSKKKSLEDFVVNAQRVHGDKYDYSKFIYNGNKVKGEVICPKHGMFLVKPNSHISGKTGCPNCYKEAVQYTTESLVDAFRNVHGEKYDYSKVVYGGMFVKVDVLCRNCNQSFPVRANNHLWGETGCPNCCAQKIKSYNSHRSFYNTETIIEAFRQVRGDKFDYKDVVFSKMHDKIKILCKNCNQAFWAKPYNHLHNKTGGCPKCFQLGEKNPAWNPDRDAINLNAKINGKFRALVRNTLAGCRKEKSSTELLGYSRKTLLEHITRHPNWESCKSQQWHIDHIFPVSAFTTYGITNLRIINHLTNLQPLLWFDNISKKDKYNESEFVAWCKQFTESELGTSYEEIMERYNPVAGQKTRLNTSSKYVGVKNCGKKGWYATIGCGGRKYLYLGYFANEEDAAKNYDYYCLKLYQLQPNFPSNDYSKFVPKKELALTENE